MSDRFNYAVEAAQQFLQSAKHAGDGYKKVVEEGSHAGQDALALFAEKGVLLKTEDTLVPVLRRVAIVAGALSRMPEFNAKFNSGFDPEPLIRRVVEMTQPGQLPDSTPAGAFVRRLQAISPHRRNS